MLRILEFLKPKVLYIAPGCSRKVSTVVRYALRVSPESIGDTIVLWWAIGQQAMRKTSVREMESVMVYHLTAKNRWVKAKYFGLNSHRIHLF